MPNKVALKKTKLAKQNGKCHISGAQLAADVSLIDTHRPIPKRKGGTYTDENTMVTDPVLHMVVHGTLRILTGDMFILKQLVDEREHAIRIHLKLNNQLLAYKRKTDHLSDRTIDFLGTQAIEAKAHSDMVDKKMKSLVKKMAKEDPFIRALLGVRAVGPVTIAYCLVWIDLEKARHASSLWSYAGLHKASHERYEKNVAGGGNKRLRTVLYSMAASQMKLAGPYRVVYDNVKHRLERSEKIVKTRNTQGKSVECA